MGNPVAWFEIPVLDIERASAFYGRVFSVTFQRMEMFGMVMSFFPMTDGEYGCAGTLVAAPGYKPSADGVLIYFSSSDIAATLAAVEAAGGRTIVGETPIGEYGWIAHVVDTEGNKIGLHKPPQM